MGGICFLWKHCYISIYKLFKPCSSPESYISNSAFSSFYLYNLSYLSRSMLPTHQTSNFEVWPIYFLTNVFIALKATHFCILLTSCSCNSSNVDEKAMIRNRYSLVPHSARHKIPNGKGATQTSRTTSSTKQHKRESQEDRQFFLSRWPPGYLKQREYNRKRSNNDN